MAKEPSKEPSPESVARAARLREQIDKLTKPQPKESTPAEPEPASPPSPRDFIHKRMRELDKKGE